MLTQSIHKPYLILALFALLVPCHRAGAQELLSFDAWKTRCLKTPPNRVLQGRMPSKKLLPIADFATARSVAKQLLKQYQTGTLSVGSNWLGTRPRGGRILRHRSQLLSASSDSLSALHAEDKNSRWLESDLPRRLSRRYPLLHLFARLVERERLHGRFQAQRK